jgi:VIT1/CCC1 family predicted Fe2+/Mn2+ transporter
VAAVVVIVAGVALIAFGISQAVSGGRRRRREEDD